MKTLKYAWRFLMRSKSYTIINLLGLAFSLACSIILMRYIHRELTVDTHCIDREHVYAICTNTEGNRGLSGLKQYNYDTISIDNRFVEAMTTYIPLEKDYVISGTNRIPARCLVTDSVFFQLFHYPIVQGKLSLTTPQSALLTEKYARKIFGNENPIGKVLRYSNGKDITVEGIVGKPECKTTINFDIILSSKLSQHWERMNTELYRFLPGTDINAINKTGSVPRYINDPKYDTRTHTFSLISVKDIYWDGSLTDREPAMFLSGNHSHLIILSGVCLLLLLTGILNFINLYLVALLRRGKEYGLKKVFGVCGKTLFANIWIENTLLVLSALLVSWLIIEIMPVHAVEDVVGVQVAVVELRRADDIDGGVGGRFKVSVRVVGQRVADRFDPFGEISVLEHEAVELVGIGVRRVVRQGFEAAERVFRRHEGLAFLVVFGVLRGGGLEVVHAV